MNDKERNQRTNDALQSSEDDLALGEDARAFGEGGQRVQRAFEPAHKDAPDREPRRDPTVPRSADSGEEDR